MLFLNRSNFIELQYLFMGIILVFVCENKNNIIFASVITRIMINTIRTTVNKFSFGFVFIPSDFAIDTGKQVSVNSVLNNMVGVGEIRRLSQGRFYKNQITKLEELTPATYQNELAQLAFNEIPNEKEVFISFKKLINNLYS